MTSFLEKPRYYDAPDGEKPIDKIVASAKKGFIGGLTAGVYDAAMITDTRTPLATLNCLAYWVVPIVGISATWASVTYMSTKIRGKDDWINYVLGSAACCPILYAWRKSTPYALWGTSVLMVAALVARHRVDVGWELFPAPKHMYGNYMHDFTVIKNYDKDFRSSYKFN